MRILLVEDDKNNVETLSILLDSLNRPHCIAMTINAALGRLKIISYDAILLDLLINGSKSIPVIDYCQNQKLKTKIVLMSGWKEAKTVFDAYRLDFLLDKPFALESIEDILNKIV